MVGQETQDIYDTINKEEREGTLYKTSLEALGQHFCIKKNIPFEKSIFRAAKQLEKESIEQYITRLQQLAQYCEYGNKIENNIRDQIISSCLSSKLRKWLFTEPDLTLTKLAQIAQVMKDASHYTKQIEQKNQIPSQVAESLNKLNLHKPQQDRQKHQHRRQQAHHHLPQKGCSRCGAKGHQVEVCRRSRNEKCHNCAKIGHFSNTCRTRKRHPPNYKQQQRNKSNNFRTRNQQDQHVRTAAVENVSSDDDVNVFQIGNKPNTHSVLINVTEINVVGSTSNMLDENSFDSIMPQPKLDKSSTKIYPYQSDSPL